MPDEPERTGRDPETGRWIKGNAGNLNGRPRGAKDHITRVLDQLDQAAAEAALAVLHGVLDKARAGDLQAAAIVLARLWAPRKGRPVAIALPPITAPADVTAALSVITAAVAAGEITPDEAGAIASVIETARKNLELVEIEKRLTALETAARR